MTLHMAWTITGIVDDIYRPGAITAAADDSLEQTAVRLEDKDISALVILDGYRLAGIITERDIVRAVADGATWPTAPPANT
jgi:CBS domain-containing protein